MRTALVLIGGLTLGIALAGGALLATQSGSAGATRDPGTAATIERTTTAVTRETLRSTEELDATLGYDGSGSLAGGLSGTITGLPAEGDILQQGDVIFEVDGNRRSVLLYGTRPAWRTMQVGTVGADVKQLEEALQTLGYLKKSIEPDRTFTTNTRDAVKEWQADLGVTKDGVVDLGEVVFTGGPVRIAQLQAQLGGSARPGATIASTTSGTRVVSLPLDADRQDILTLGDRVGITLPDDTETSGSISGIGRVATTDANGDTTVEVTVSLDDPTVTGTLDGSPVTVTITRESREGVLTVPVDALLALQEGGYAVELAASDGSTRLVGVETGLYADGRVQVTGSLSEGDDVVVPR